MDIPYIPDVASEGDPVKSRQCPLGRLTGIAGPIAFFISDGVRFATGRVLVVDGRLVRL